MLYLVANPLSGGGKGKKYLALVEEHLQQKGVSYTLLISTFATESVALGRRCKEDAACTSIGVLGGDGTFNEVITGVGDCTKPIGFIGAGTGNDFIRAACLPKDPIEAVDIILAGHTRAIDVLDCGSRRCLNVLGTGLDVELLMRAIKYRRFFKNSLSYYFSLIVTLFTYKDRTFTFCLDGGETHTVTGMLLSVANGRYCGGGLPVAPIAEISDGYIDFVVIKKINRLRLPYLFAKFLKGKLLTIKDVSFYRCKSLTMDVSPALPLNCDGELINDLPISVFIAEPLLMFCPLPAQNQ